MFSLTAVQFPDEAARSKHRSTRYFSASIGWIFPFFYQLTPGRRVQLKWRYENQKFSLALVSITALPWLLTGCHTFSHVYGGQPVRRETAASLSVGLPYPVAVSELGEPLLYIDGQRAVAYRWDTYDYIRESRGWAWWLANIIPDYKGPLNDFAAPEIVGMRYHAFCLKFGENQRLESWTYIEDASQEQMWEQMITWAGQRPPQAPAMVASSKP